MTSSKNGPRCFGPALEQTHLSTSLKFKAVNQSGIQLLSRNSPSQSLAIGSSGIAVYKHLGWKVSLWEVGVQDHQ